MKKMKKIVLGLAIMAIALLGLVASGCVDRSVDQTAPAVDIIVAGAVEVMPNVYDDSLGNAYIRVDRPTTGKEDAAVAEIITKTNSWQLRFPNKRVVTASVVTGDSGMGYGYPIVAGLLIHYEYK